MNCLRCSDTTLVERHGALLEAVCPTCGGRFLDDEAATKVVDELLGIDRATLLELIDHFGGKRSPCPGCERELSPVPLRGVHVAVCRSCGGLWCDGGDLTRLTGGRVEEVGKAAAANASQREGDSPFSGKRLGKRRAVLLHNPSDFVRVENAQAKGLAIPDTSSFWPGVAFEGLDERTAHFVTEALSAVGVEASVTPELWRDLPDRKKANRLLLDDETFGWASPSGRTETRPWTAVRAIVCGQVGMRASLSTDSGSPSVDAYRRMEKDKRKRGRVHIPSNDLSHHLREKEEVILEVAVRDPWARVRFAAGDLLVPRTERGEDDVETFALLLDRLVPRAQEARLGESVRALLTDRRAEIFPHVGALEREETWLLWR